MLVWADQDVFKDNPRVNAKMKRGCTYVSNVYKDVLMTEEDESD